jgi:hypothetical protein
MLQNGHSGDGLTIRQNRWPSSAQRTNLAFRPKKCIAWQGKEQLQKSTDSFKKKYKQPFLGLAGKGFKIEPNQQSRHQKNDGIA